MRKSSGFAPVWISSIVVLVIFCGAVFVSPTFQVCIENGATEDATHGQQEKLTLVGPSPTWLRCGALTVDENHNLIVAIATMVLAVFTISLWAATNRLRHSTDQLWEAGEKQISLTKEAFINEKRAFVFPVDMRWEWFHAGGGAYEFRIRPVWRNSGDTPTRGMRIHTDCELRNSTLPPSFRFDQATTHIGNGLIGPHIQMYGGHGPAMDEPGITQQDLVEIQAGRRFLYIWGWATYRDVFPNTEGHITRFCWAITCLGDPRVFDPNVVDPPPAVGAIRLDYTQHDIGNCVDSECPQ